MELTQQEIGGFEAEWYMYPRIDRLIATRKLELQIKEADENIGGGKTNIPSRVIENQVVKELSDPFIEDKEKIKKSINKTYEKLDEELQDIVRQKYWDTTRRMSWKELGDLLGYSKNSMYRRRDEVMMRYAQQKGRI